MAIALVKRRHATISKWPRNTVNVNRTRQSTIHDPLRMTSKHTLDVQCARLLLILFEDTRWRSSYF
jgi:hypothetical protein